jgi:predicted GH43/DUF377 family glycosyl hydrolase
MRFILSNYVQPILLKTNEGSCNCSTFTENGKRYLISRNVTYYLVQNQSYIIDGKYHTKNFLYELLNDYSLKPIKELETITGNNDCIYFGLEDIRTVKWNNSNYFLCTKVHGNTDDGTMCLGEIKNCSLTNIKEIKTTNRREKNWAPIEVEPFNAIYSNHPGKKIDLKDASFYDLPNNEKVSGSTPLVKYDNYNLAIVHTKDENFTYYHYFVLYDKNYTIVKKSEAFSFFGNKTEFCCELKCNNDNIEIFMSVNDGISYVFNLSKSLVKDILENNLDNNTFNDSVYDKFFEDAVKIHAWNVAAVQALAVHAKDNLELGIQINHEKASLNPQDKAKIQKQLLGKYYL